MTEHTYFGQHRAYLTVQLGIDITDQEANVLDSDNSEAAEQLAAILWDHALKARLREGGIIPEWETEII